MIPERIIFVSRGITVLEHNRDVLSKKKILYAEVVEDNYVNGTFGWQDALLFMTRLQHITEREHESVCEYTL